DGLAVVEPCERTIASALGRQPTPAPRGVAAAPRAARADEIVVIGASGFIGRRLVSALAAQERSVTGAGRGRGLAPRAWHTAGVRIVAGDLGDAASLARAVEGARRVVHLATGGGERWEDFERVMIGGTRAIAEACSAARVEQLVYTS